LTAGAGTDGFSTLGETTAGWTRSICGGGAGAGARTIGAAGTEGGGDDRALRGMFVRSDPKSVIQITDTLTARPIPSQIIGRFAW
jgi:hypothetical protein